MSERIDTQILKARISAKIRRLEDKAMRSGASPVSDEDTPTIEELPDPEAFRKMLADARK
jgi:hypothetical protein